MDDWSDEKIVIKGIYMDNLKVKLTSSMEKIVPSKEPSGEGFHSNMTALKGETVSFQIGYYWDGGRKQRGRVKVQAPEGVQVCVKTVGLVPCAYPCHPKRDDGYLAVEPGLYPDLLSEITEVGFPIITGQWRSLWVDITTTEETKGGEYGIEIELEKIGEDCILGRCSVSLEVVDAVLPKLHIPHTEWFHCDCLANYYETEVFSEKHWEVIENFVAHAVKRGCNMILTPIFTPPLDTAVGGERRTVQLVDITVTENGYEFGYEKFERWVSMCKRCRVEYFEISHLFSQWGAVATPKIVGMVEGREQKLFGWETKATGEAYSTFIKAFLDSFVREIESLGIGEKCYFHISDEPELQHMESYAAAKNLVKEPLKDYHVVDALSEHAFFEKGIIMEPVCANDHIEPFLKNRPEKLWTYYCTAQCVDVSNRFIAQPGFRTRILGAQLYKYAIDGFLHWGYNFYNSEYSLYPINPYQCTDADGAFPSGDPFLVYPGADGHPVDSVRSMLMDETFADLRAMKYLESLIGREKVLEYLGEEENGMLTFAKYPQRAGYIIDMRDKINGAIKAALQK